MMLGSGYPEDSTEDEFSWNKCMYMQQIEGTHPCSNGFKSSKLIVLKVKLWGMLKWRRGEVDEPRLILMDDSALADS